MPKIPRIGTSAGVSASQPRELERPGQSSVIGKGLQQLGKDFQETMLRHSAYKTVKDNLDRTLSRKQSRAAGKIEIENLKKDLAEKKPVNGKVVEFDGGLGGSPSETGYTDIFKEGYSQFVAEYTENITRPDLKAIAETELLEVLADNWDDVLDAEKILGIKAQVKVLGDGIDLGADLVRKNPRLYDSQKADLKDAVKQSLLPEPEQEKLNNEIDKELSAAAISSFTIDKEWDKARKFITDEIGGTEATTLLKNLESNRLTRLRSDEFEVKLKRKENERRLEDNEEKFMQEIIEWTSSDDPADRQKALAFAQAQFGIDEVSEKFLDAVRKRVEIGDRVDNEKTVKDLLTEIENMKNTPTNRKKMRIKIMEAVDSLSDDSYKMLLDRVSDRKVKRKGPSWKEANLWIKRAFGPTELEDLSESKFLTRTERKEREAMEIAVKQEAMRLVKTKGYSPMQAAHIATKKIDPNNEFLKIAQGASVRSAKERHDKSKIDIEDAKKFRKKLKNSKKVSPETVRKYRLELERKLKEKNAAESSLSVQDSLKLDQELPDKKRQRK